MQTGVVLKLRNAHGVPVQGLKGRLALAISPVAGKIYCLVVLPLPKFRGFSEAQLWTSDSEIVIGISSMLLAEIHEG